MSIFTQNPREDVIDAVYDAAFSPGEWQRVCDMLDASLGGAHVSIATHDLSSGRHVGAYFTRYTDEYYKSYKDYYYRFNPFIDAIRSKGVVGPVAFEQLVSSEQLDRSEFYNDWLKPQGDLSAGATFVVSDAEHQLTLFSAMVPRSLADDKMPRILETLSHLVPHVRRSMKLNVDAFRLVSRASVLETFMEEARAAFIVLDAAARPLEVNHQARILFDNGTLSLDLRGALVLHDAKGAEFIENAVHQAIAGTKNFGDGINLNIEGQVAPCFLRAIPLGSQGRMAAHQLLGTRSTAVVIISIASSQPILKAAQARFGLTPAEMAVLSGLMEGMGIRDLAAVRNTSVNTVRNQVSALLDKTSTSSQKELLSLFASPKRI